MRAYVDSMLLLLIAFSVLFLVIGHALLIKKCSKLTNELEPSAQSLSGELKDITSILDDIADLFNDALSTINNSPIAQTASSPMESILSGLISSVMTPKNHGNTQEPQIGEVHEIYPPTLQTENESN
ncbi:hypothetical protein OAM96_05740 [Candidatus Poseidoniaceae archaeon]|nr:hypothetical protein [Candidatus Poseidoniaceae archaeon]